MAWAEFVAAEALHGLVHGFHERGEVELGVGAGFFEIRLHALLADFVEQVGAELVGAGHLGLGAAFVDFLEALLDEFFALLGLHGIEGFHEAAHGLDDGEIDEEVFFIRGEFAEEVLAGAVFAVFFAFLEVEAVDEGGDVAEFLLGGVWLRRRPARISRRTSRRNWPRRRRG